VTTIAIARQMFELAEGLTEAEFDRAVANVRACRFADAEPRLPPRSYLASEPLLSGETRQ
jgi:hypothetical protein